MRRIFLVLISITIFLQVLYELPLSAQLLNGDFSSGLSGWDAMGDVSTSNNGTAVLLTGGIDGLYETSLSTSFTILGDSLDFRYYFDINGTDEIKYPDFPSFGPDFFQMTLDAGTEGWFDIPLAWAPTGGFVPFSLDIASIAPGTMARLTFLLFDEDDGQRSIAGIDDVTDPLQPSQPLQEPETLILLGGGLVGVFLFSRYHVSRRILGCILILLMIQILSSTANAELQEINVDDKATLQFTSPVFNTRTNILTLNMGITNISDTAVFTPIKVVITEISSPDVSVSNPDGYTPEGLPFFNMDSFVVNKGLLPGEKSRTSKISFRNPKKVKFRWDQDVIAFVDVPVDTGPVIYNICVVPGELPPVCEFDYDSSDEKNPEFERILQNTMPEMYLYEQVRVYAFDYNDLPIKVMINGYEASYNGNGFYYYSVLTLKQGSNTLSAVVTNDAGVSTSRDITMNIDSVPPAINILNAAGLAIVTSPEIVINGSVDDPEINMISLRKDFITSEDVPVVNGLFSANVFLYAGHNNLSFEATDRTGNSGNYDLDITRVYSISGDIRGKVYNSVLGVPVSGAVITFNTSRGALGTVVSDDAGSYSINGVNSGDVILHVEKDGYDPVNLKVFSPGGSAPNIQDIALIPSAGIDTFTLTGQVQDTGESPVSGVKISVKDTPLSAMTDNNGIYIISGIPRTSFIADASKVLYEGKTVIVDSRMFGSDTKIITHNFILNNVARYVNIVTPADGEMISGHNVLVTGSVKSEAEEFGVIVNGLPALVYNGYFTANDIPLKDGANKITAEVITPLDTLAGTLLTDSVDVTHPVNERSEFAIYAQEAGLVPLEIPVVIEFRESTGDIALKAYNLSISGPGTSNVISDGELRYKVSITGPGVYTFTFNATDSSGNVYKDTFGFTGMVKGDVESTLRQIWSRFKDSLIAGNAEDAMLLFMPDTRSRYKEQMLLLGDQIQDTFANIGDIQLISLNDNEAKTRIYEGDITHYVWFAKDIYGLWKIHKF